MKIHTDLVQSNTLASILSLDSADMCWKSTFEKNNIIYVPEFIPYKLYSGIGTPCWSLTGLLNAYCIRTLDISDGPEKMFRAYGLDHFSEWYDDPIDACYELILELHNKNLI